MGRFDNLHGDEDFLDYEYSKIREEYWESCADDWKYSEERITPKPGEEVTKVEIP